MTIFATYDTSNNNVVTGYYVVPNVHRYEDVPLPHLGISDETHREALEHASHGDIVRVNDDEDGLEYIVIGLSVLKQRKIATLEFVLQKNISKDITVSSVDYSVDMFKMTLIKSALAAFADATLTGSIDWLLANNTVGSVDQASLTAVLDAYAIRMSHSMTYAGTLIASMNECDNKEDLDAIDITTGWPS